MEFTPLILLAALVAKFIDFLKAVTNKEWNSVVTQTVTWVAGIVAVVLFAQTGWASQVDILGLKLSVATAAEQAVLGLMATSVLSVVYDFKKAVDGSDSAKTPSLIPPKS